MSSTAENRAKFVNSAKAFLTKYKFDGIDIDWEYPTSSARDNAVKITCKQFRSVHDAGGTAADTPNIVALFKDLRGGLPTASISYAAPANVDHAKLSDVAHVANYLDYFHLMTYDYAVSDVPGATMFSPNSPLYTPPAPAVQMSIDYTVQGYLGMGIKPSQLQLGVSYYGHGWFNDEFTDASQWQKFGGKDGKVQGSCCGPFTQTYGNAPGKGSGQCGSLMYSEIVAAGFENYYDNVTQSDIGYLSKDSADGVTKKGVWITYNGPTSMQKIAEYAKKWKLAGVFAYDSSMDTLDYKAGNYTYGLSNLIAKILNNHTNDETEGTLIESDESFEMLA
jgi:chitinase